MKALYYLTVREGQESASVTYVGDDDPDPFEAMLSARHRLQSRIYFLQMYIYEVSIMQVSRWGNSLAIRLPAAVVEALGLRAGDDVILHAAGKRRLEIEKTPGAKELLARLRRFRGRLPKDFKFDRLEAHERR